MYQIFLHVIMLQFNVLFALSKMKLMDEILTFSLHYFWFCIDVLFSFYTVHRIGRTGRCGKTGIATTFINKACGK